MSDADALEEALEAAREALARNASGDLPLGYRQLVWSRMGTRSSAAESARDNTGRKRRTSLAIACTRKALPEWQKIWPNDDTPIRLVSRAEDVVAQRFSLERAEKEWNDALTYCDNLVVDYQAHRMTAMVCSAAALALYVALHDEEFDPDSIGLELTDADTDEIDSSLSALIAYANGGPWEECSSSEKRREFWQWWLTEVRRVCELDE